ncbi:hypothetical protein K435DRAFT_692670 [Dendrothele bispora CBS 962.96]|uniref:F-box domain-containing protein n=1 Tax=Dendrothele bispora (strain CBS 962.96) TaxID=1314807 RepID=A0A4S8L1Q0_DENBC|nr:hypothetical protein K435DRAFT_692670 [Dendrothele bispora CBS 962.96]
MTLPFDFPQEFVDTVIDQVQDCPNTLKSCSLVARIWLPRSRTHLYRIIVISPTE